MDFEEAQKTIEILKRYNYQHLEAITYGQLAKMYPHYMELSARVQAELGRDEINPEHYMIMSSAAMEYILGLDSADTIMKVEFYFELMFQYVSEMEAIIMKEQDPLTTERAINERRRAYSFALEHEIRPKVTKVARDYLS
ncbi:hypothetical protein D1872_38540 [compost metagenome]